MTTKQLNVFVFVLGLFSNLVGAQNACCSVGHDNQMEQPDDVESRHFYLNTQVPATCDMTVTSWKYCYYPTDVDANQYETPFAVYRFRRERILFTLNSYNEFYERISDTYHIRATRNNISDSFTCQTITTPEVQVQQGDVIGVCMQDVFPALNTRSYLTLIGDTGSDGNRWLEQSSELQTGQGTLCNEGFSGGYVLTVPQSIQTSQLSQQNSRVLHLYAESGMCATFTTPTTHVVTSSSELQPTANPTPTIPSNTNTSLGPTLITSTDERATPSPTTSSQTSTVALHTSIQNVNHASTSVRISPSATTVVPIQTNVPSNPPTASSSDNPNNIIIDGVTNPMKAILGGIILGATLLLLIAIAIITVVLVVVGVRKKRKRNGSFVIRLRDSIVQEHSGGLDINHGMHLNPATYEDPLQHSFSGFTNSFLLSSSIEISQSYDYPSDSDRMSHNAHHTQDEVVYDAPTRFASFTYQDLLEKNKEEDIYAQLDPYCAPPKLENDIYEHLQMYGIVTIPRTAIAMTVHLGSGQFGNVQKGLWKCPGITDHVPVALKILKEGSSKDDKVKFLQEAAIMAQFKHPNVITLYGVVSKGEPVTLVVELASEGDLRKYIMSLHPDPEELPPTDLPSLLLTFSQQVALGMQYLAGKGFVHRDLAARNILVTENKVCKVADFGLSRDLLDETYYISSGGKVPIKWTAPEAIFYKKFSTASDVWSYGCLLYEIWSLGRKPFHGLTNATAMRLIEANLRLPSPPGCPRMIYELMILCWHPESVRRPSFRDLVLALGGSKRVVLNIPQEALDTHQLAGVLGAPLQAGEMMYKAIQDRYIS